MSIELAVQIAIRSRLITTAEVTALVPQKNILDRSARPIIDPSIIIGEGHMMDEGNSIGRDRVRVYSTLHVWKREGSLAGVKSIAWAIRGAVRQGRLELGPVLHCADCLVSSHRYLRDPDGETSHAVVTVETLVQELS